MNRTLIHGAGATDPAEAGRAGRSTPVVPDHELIHRIGAGAYGEVWLARNVMGTLRAVKIVHRADFTDDRPYEREFRGIQRFEPISRSNEGFVDVLQIGRDDAQGLFYYVMELADDQGGGAAGAYAPRTLASEIRGRGRLPYEECVPVAITLTLALAHLHRHGLIHRDVKPANIVFVGGIPKLADIGLVTEVGQARSFVGTEGFIAPEGPNSAQGDIYSLGKVLYEMGMGKDRLDFPEPFSGFGRVEESPQLEELNAVILRACAPDPGCRYRTAEEMHVDLALLQSGKSVKSRRRLERRLAWARKGAAFVAAFALLAGGGFLFQRHQTRTARRFQQYAESLVGRMQVEGAETLFARDESALALAQLAAVVRSDPSNRVAAERILDALVHRRFPSLVLPPLRHEVPVSGVRFSPDGRWIASAAGDHTVRLWDATTGEPLAARMGHEDRITALVFHPDGSSLATASMDGTVRLWTVPEGALMRPPVWHGAGVKAVCFSPDGRWLATAGDDGEARMIDVATGASLGPVLRHGDRVNDVQFSPDGRWLATAAEDGRVRIWDAATGRIRHAFPVRDRAAQVRFSRDGRRLAATIQTTEWEVRVWEVETGEPAGPVLLHEHRLYSLDFSPDGRRLAVATFDLGVRVWEIATGRHLHTLPHSSGVYVAAYSPDGGQILTAALDHTARLWNVSNGRPVSEPMRHDGRVVAAGFSPDGRRVVTASWDRTVRVWEARSITETRRILKHGHWVLSAGFDRTGSQLLTMTGGGVFTANQLNSWAWDRTNTLTLWRVEDATQESVVTLPRGEEPLVAQFTGTGVWALVLHRRMHTTGRLWHLPSGRQIDGVIRHGATITTAHFRPDGRAVATGSTDGTVRLWDTGTGELLGPAMRHGAPVRALQFRSDGAVLLSAGDDGRVRLWDGISGAETGPTLVHDGPEAVTCARFSPDGKWIVTAAQDGAVRLWSTDGRLLATFRHSAPVEWVEFSADGRKVATASGDCTARVWDTVTGQPVTEPLTHEQLVTMARFSPDGRRLITASFDGTARVWDVETGLKLGEAVRHDGWVMAACFSPDGRTALSGSLDGTVRLWSVPVVEAPVPDRVADLAESMAGLRLKPDGGREVLPAGEAPSMTAPATDGR